MRYLKGLSFLIEIIWPSKSSTVFGFGFGFGFHPSCFLVLLSLPILASFNKASTWVVMGKALMIMSVMMKGFKLEAWW